MNEKQLEEALRSLKVPPPDATRLEQSLRCARAALDDPDTATPNGNRRPWRIVAWAAAGIAAVLAFLIVIPSLLTHQRDIPTARSDFRFVGPDDSRRLLQEVRMLFPDRLQAVIVRAEGMDIRLHAEPTRISDQPILVELSAPGAEPIQLISYSGQTVETTFANRQLRLDLMLTGVDGVLILGDDFVWTEQEAVGVGDLQIRARRLEVRS